MARIEHSDVQMAEPWDFRVFLRELNSRFRSLVQVVNQNRIDSGPNNVFSQTVVNGAPYVWLATGDYTIESMTAKVSTGTGSVTPRINAVTVGGTVPFLVGLTPTRFPISTPNTIEALQILDVITSGLTGTLIMSFEVRRLN